MNDPNMDTCTLLEKTAMLKRINDNNAENLLKLGIDMNALPSNIENIIKEFVDTQQVTGLHEMDLINLELWHLHRKDEVIDLEQGILKPLQRKVRKINAEVEREQKKIKALDESITDFNNEIIADDEFRSRFHEIELVIAEAEKGITETPLPPVQLDCDNLINKVNKLNADRKLKCKTAKKY